MKKQACLDAVVNPPKPNEPSYEQFIRVTFSLNLIIFLLKFILNSSQEKNEVLDGLKEKAILVTKLFNSIEGVKCNPVQGAMYAFPQILIPQRAIEEAKVKNFFN